MLAQVTPHSPAAKPAPVRICGECGDAYASRSPTVEFCGEPCRKAFNNRRAVRGAEIYDLLMALRFDRKAAKRLQVWRALCRMASAFRAEDLAARDGRPSWRAPAKILERRPYLLATTVKGRS